MPTDKRIKLRSKKPSDAREDYDWQTDAELVKLDAAIELKLTYQEYFAEYTFDLCYPSSNRHEFAIDTLGGEHIGNCVFYNIINPSDLRNTSKPRYLFFKLPTSVS